MSQATWKSVGTGVSDTTGAVTPIIPTHAAGDWMWLIAESVNTTWGSDPSGWTVVIDETFTTLKKLKVWRKLAASGAETDPTITPTGGNHIWAVVALTDNVHATEPVHFMAVEQIAAGTDQRFPSFKTLVDDCLVLQIGAYSIDNAGPICSAEANTSFTPVERFDAGTADGNGGGLVIYSGPATAPGDYASTTFTCTSTGWIVATLVLAPIADKTIAGTVTINGSPASNGNDVRAIDLTQPAASYLCTVATTTGGTGAFTISAPYTDHDYQAVYEDGASYGASAVDQAV
jgi:hypothetical protein